MTDDIRLGRLFGIEIFISYSWFLIFALVTVTLAFGFFPQQFPNHAWAANIVIGAFASACFFASLLFHEFSHSLVANLNNIPIKKITLFVFGGISQMSREPRDPISELKMALAGPFSSFFLAGLFYIFYSGLAAAKAPSELYAAFGWLWQINFFLAVFNLAPGYPLDGGRVLRAIIWYATKNLRTATNIAARSGQAIGFLLISLGFILFIGRQLGGIWLILIGWFLYQSAVAGFRQLVIEQTLADVDVIDIMSRNVQTVPPELNLDELVNHYFLRYRFGRFPVAAAGKLHGIVTLHDVKTIPKEKWPTTSAADIMEPVGEAMLIREKDHAIKALMRMAGEEAGHLLVLNEDEQLVGIVTRADIIKLIQVRNHLGEIP